MSWNKRPCDPRAGALVCTLALVLFVPGGTALAQPISIDDPPPPFADPPSPWHSLAGDPVITYAFKTSWDGIGWTSEQQNTVRGGIDELDSLLPNQTFSETGDFTLRFAGADFFKDWRDSGTYNDPGWNLTNPLAVSYKHDNGPWKGLKDSEGKERYPNNEIYINITQPFHFDLATPPPADKYDFFTVALHEMIHMLACDAHATHENEVMYETLGKGQRKMLQESDKQILRNAGYKLIPEPGGLTAAVLLLTAVMCHRPGRRPRYNSMDGRRLPG